jgi:hypothetical protein
MLVTGYYEFEIIIDKKLQNKRDLIYRRYSDIEWLHEGLLKLNPGCRIPEIPEKNIWCNLNVNNTQLLDKRRVQIEKYLKYIYAHRFLRENKYFQNFINDNFEKFKEEHMNKTGILDKMTKLSNYYVPSVFMNNKLSGSIMIENKNLEDDKKNLERLLKGVNELLLNIVNNILLNI